MLIPRLEIIVVMTQKFFKHTYVPGRRFPESSIVDLWDPAAPLRS